MNAFCLGPAAWHVTWRRNITTTLKTPEALCFLPIIKSRSVSICTARLGSEHWVPLLYTYSSICHICHQKLFYNSINLSTCATVLGDSSLCISQSWSETSRRWVTPERAVSCSRRWTRRSSSNGKHIDSVGLNQNLPTHDGGHSLDLILTFRWV